MVPIRRLSDATPIARGKIPLTIPILTTGELDGEYSESTRSALNVTVLTTKLAYPPAPLLFCYPAGAHSRLVSTCPHCPHYL